MQSTRKYQADRATTDLVRNYLHEIGRIPLLTHEQEVLYGKQVQQMKMLLARKVELEEINPTSISQADWAQAVELTESELEQALVQGQRAKNKMIQANLRLVVSVAKQYLRRNMELLDLIQEGSLGLERGVDKFDPSKGYRFSTYAYWWIRQAMTRAIAQQSRTIRLPVHIVEQLNKIKKHQRILAQQLGRQATPHELAVQLKMETEKVKRYLKLSRRTLSLDIRMGDQQDTALMDLLEDETSISPDDYVTQNALIQDIQAVFAELSPLQQDVLTLRFGLGDGEPLSFAKIGDRLNLSRERIRRLINQALDHIRQHHSEDFQEYLAS